MQIYRSRITQHITMVLLATIAVSLSAQTREFPPSVTVTSAIDGKSFPCDHLRIELRRDGRTIELKYTSRGFAIPTAFNNKSSVRPAQKKVDVSVSCSKYTLTFPKVPGTWLRPGSWEVGIVHPPYWFNKFRYAGEIEHATWLSYLAYECNKCDPGVITSISHRSPSASVVKSLQDEQPAASGERARDVAYALAVYDVKYQENRDHVVGLLNTCLSRPKESAEDDICDHRLLDYVTNLYWRGDNTLLPLLLQIADSRKDVIGEIGTFYESLLDRRTVIAVGGLQSLSIAKQEAICQLAGADDSTASPKLNRVAHQLRGVGGEIADRCLREAARAAQRKAQ